jgi:hypothetical protein
MMAGAGCAGSTGDGDDTGARPDAGGFTTIDGPGGDPSGCETDIVEAPTAVACAAATQTCIEACATDECPDACVTADPDPDGCGTCLEEGWLACVNTMGCQAEWDTVSCCYEECADPESAACETTCAAESAAYDTCSEAYEDTCATSTDAICYP